jgi:flagellar motor switch protein FliM
MAEKVLSQDEMDALLQGVQSGQVDTRISLGATSGVHPYDLTNVNHYMTLNPVPAIKVVSDLFLPPFQIALTQAFRKEVKASLLIVEMGKFDSFLDKIPPMSSYHLIKVDPLTNTMLLVFTASTVYFLLEHFYGGDGRMHAKTEGDYTLIEKRFIQKVVDILLATFQKAWTPIKPVKISMIRAASHPRTMRVLQDKDWVVTARFKLEIDDAAEEFYFCFSFAHLEPLRSKLYGGPEHELELDTRWQPILIHYVKESGWVNVTGCVGSSVLSAPEISRLEVGDIITLDREASHDMELLVEDYPKFHGQPGVYRGKNAFQVRSVIHPKS